MNPLRPVSPSLPPLSSYVAVTDSLQESRRRALESLVNDISDNSLSQSSSDASPPPHQQSDQRNLSSPKSKRHHRSSKEHHRSKRHKSDKHRHKREDHPHKKRHRSSKNIKQLLKLPIVIDNSIIHLTEDLTGDRSTEGYGCPYSLYVPNYTIWTRDYKSKVTLKRTVPRYFDAQEIHVIKAGDPSKSLLQSFHALSTLSYRHITSLSRHPPLLKTKIDPTLYLPLPDASSRDVDRHGSSSSNIESSIETIYLEQNKLFNEALRKSPGNVDLWLRFVALQDQIDFFTKGDRSIINIKKKIILETAIKTIPSSARLLTAYHRLLCANEDADTIANRWDEAVATHQTNAKFWIAYLNQREITSRNFNVSALRSAYGTSVSVLSASLRSMSSDEDLCDGELAILDVLRSYVVFESRVGYQCRAIAVLQALVEYNWCCPKELEVNRYERRKVFDMWWESGAPRLGDKNGYGWGHWFTHLCSSQPLSTLVDEDQILHGDDIDSEIGLNYESNASYIRPNKLDDLFEWAKKEVLHDDFDWLPLRSSEVSYMSNDPHSNSNNIERICLIDDISPFLVVFQSEKCRLGVLMLYLESITLPCRDGRSGGSNAPVTGRNMTNESMSSFLCLPTCLPCALFATVLQCERMLGIYYHRGETILIEAVATSLIHRMETMTQMSHRSPCTTSHNGVIFSKCRFIRHILFVLCSKSTVTITSNHGKILDLLSFVWLKFETELESNKTLLLTNNTSNSLVSKVGKYLLRDHQQHPLRWAHYAMAIGRTNNTDITIVWKILSKSFMMTMQMLKENENEWCNVVVVSYFIIEFLITSRVKVPFPLVHLMSKNASVSLPPPSSVGVIVLIVLALIKNMIDISILDLITCIINSSAAVPESYYSSPSVVLLLQQLISSVPQLKNIWQSHQETSLNQLRQTLRVNHIHDFDSCQIVTTAVYNAMLAGWMEWVWMDIVGIDGTGSHEMSSLRCVVRSLSNVEICVRKGLSDDDGDDGRDPGEVAMFFISEANHDVATISSLEIICELKLDFIQLLEIVSESRQNSNGVACRMISATMIREYLWSITALYPSSPFIISSLMNLELGMKGKPASHPSDSLSVAASHNMALPRLRHLFGTICEMRNHPLPFLYAASFELVTMAKNKHLNNTIDGACYGGDYRLRRLFNQLLLTDATASPMIWTLLTVFEMNIVRMDQQQFQNHPSPHFKMVYSSSYQRFKRIVTLARYHAPSLKMLYLKLIQMPLFQDSHSNIPVKHKIVVNDGSAALVVAIKERLDLICTMIGYGLNLDLISLQQLCHV